MSTMTLPELQRPGFAALHFFVAINSRISILKRDEVALSQRLPRLKKKSPISSPAKRRGGAHTEERHASVGSEHNGAEHGAGGGQLSFRPLTLERRKARDLPRETGAQMQELELLAQSLMKLQEAQQKKVSRELHDNVAQVLSAVTNRITLARTSAKMPAWLRQELLGLQQDLETALTDIRILARGMRPALLDHCGLCAALDKHAEGFRQRTSIVLEMQVDSEAAKFIDPENLTHLFRLAQEALHNIEEHSGATRAWLAIVRNNGTMHLEVGDDGCGFTPERINKAQADGHLGLLGMRERAELLGGSFHLETAPAKGTTLRVAVPVPANTHQTTHQPNGATHPEFHI